MNKYINAEDLRNAMYHEAFEKESKMQKWESGCWIRYKLFENVLDAMPSTDVEPKWIPIKLGVPEDNVPVNITWVNRNPVSYYSHIKDKPFTATAVYFYGKWYWFSATVMDMLAEYGRCEFDKIDDDIEVIAWMPLPEPYCNADMGERKDNV